MLTKKTTHKLYAIILIVTSNVFVENVIIILWLLLRLSFQKPNGFPVITSLLFEVIMRSFRCLDLWTSLWKFYFHFPPPTLWPQNLACLLNKHIQELGWLQSSTLSSHIYHTRSISKLYTMHIHTSKVFKQMYCLMMNEISSKLFSWSNPWSDNFVAKRRNPRQGLLLVGVT